MSIGKIFHPGISSNYNDDQPYSWSETPYHPPTEVYKEAHVCMGQDGHMRRNLVCPVVPSLQPGETLPDLQSAAVAKAFIKRHHKLKKKKPFFLAVGFHKPHVPIKFPMKYLRHHPLANVSIPMNRLRPSGLPSVAWNPWTDVRERDDIAKLNISFPFGTMPDLWTRLITQSYSAAVSYIDDLVGQIGRELDVTNQMNNTVIVLIGDHGWSLGEHGEWSKFSNLEPSVRVPFILRIPGVTTKGVISHELVELVDLMPTLAQLAGIHVPQCPEDTGWKTQLCTEGVSLVPLVEQLIGNKNTSWKRGVFSQYPRPGLYPSAKPNSDKPHLKEIKVMGYSLRTLQYRYTEWVPFHKLLPDWSTRLAAELYDHTIDPNEESNYYKVKELKNIQRELSKQLRLGWRHSLPHKNVRIQRNVGTRESDQ